MKYYKDKVAVLFNSVFIIIICILGLTSIVALVAIHWELSKFNFSFSTKGINTYLSAYGEYKALFTGTVSTIVAYFGLHRLNAATEANVLKLKQDRFSEWKAVIDIRFIEIERKDPFMKREFIRLRLNFFEELYKLDFNIRNKEQLEYIFKKIFEGQVSFFEEQNEKYIHLGGFYPNNSYSYSLDSFRFLFLATLNDIYPDIVKDLLALYLQQLSSMRIIDPEAYKRQLESYIKFNKPIVN